MKPTVQQTLAFVDEMTATAWVRHKVRWLRQTKLSLVIFTRRQTGLIPSKRRNGKRNTHTHKEQN